MPEAWPSIRSTAKWVLPVLVGPRTATSREGAAPVGRSLMLRRWDIPRPAASAAAPSRHRFRLSLGGPGPGLEIGLGVELARAGDAQAVGHVSAGLVEVALGQEGFQAGGEI